MKHFLIILLIISWSNLSAQEIKKTQDVGLWLGASLEYEFIKDFTLKFSQDLRFFENISELDKYITDLGLEYKINRNFKLGVNIRYFLNKRNDKTISQDLRYSFELKFKTKITDMLEFKYRLRYQTAYQDFFAIVSNEIRSNFRNKISFNYALNEENAIYIGSELFRQFVFYRKPYFNKVRFLVGYELKTGVGEFDFSMRYERQLNSNYPLSYFYGRIYYNFKLKREK